MYTHKRIFLRLFAATGKILYWFDRRRANEACLGWFFLALENNDTLWQYLSQHYRIDESTKNRFARLRFP